MLLCFFLSATMFLSYYVSFFPVVELFYPHAYKVVRFLSSLILFYLTFLHQSHHLKYCFVVKCILLPWGSVLFVLLKGILYNNFPSYIELIEYF